MLRNLSTGIEASTTGESLNSGDVAVHPAARHKTYYYITILRTNTDTMTRIMGGKCRKNDFVTK